MIKKFILLLLQLYQLIISPILKQLFGNTCRYTPTCSEYTKQSIQKYGIIKGSLLGFKQLSTCHPWAKSPNLKVKNSNKR